MPTHGCIPCASGREAAQRLVRNFGEQGLAVHRAALGVRPGVLPSEDLRVYTRTEFGVTRVFSKGLDGVEVELVAVPAIPAKSPTPQEPLGPKLTLWDHLLKDD